ncbi:hypothetical protein [Gracilibacillus sp. YIM 98692]|uniref:hypothetical protein n=1 Tax=Gracilibacillus sp. YIM 98692 TaxID=2663532 RepID=UPI0013D8A010|nr:hypothetical protein [Gracilibacillus sp. YIM 98692]
MLKQYYKQLLIFSAFLIIILLLIIYNQYQENKKYEEYLSNGLNDDIQTLNDAIVDNQNIYQQVSDSEHITKQHLISLIKNNSIIKNLTQKYEYLALRLNRLESNKDYNETGKNAQTISSFFRVLAGKENFCLEPNNHFKQSRKSEPIADYFTEVRRDICNLESDEKNDVLVNLDSDLKEKLGHIQELNSFWIEASKAYETTERADDTLSNDHWINLIVDLEKETKDYLYNKHKISNIELFLKK